MTLKSKIFNLMLLCIVCVLVSGCAMFRYSIIPQENRGPRGGALTFIDQRIPEYFEFIAIPGDKEWTFQVYAYDKNLKPKHICGSGYISIELSDGTRKGVELWSTTPYFWSKGPGCLESKMKLIGVKEFVATVGVISGKSCDRLQFKYPY